MVETSTNIDILGLFFINLLLSLKLLLLEYYNLLLLLLDFLLKGSFDLLSRLPIKLLLNLF